MPPSITTEGFSQPGSQGFVSVTPTDPRYGMPVNSAQEPSQRKETTVIPKHTGSYAAKFNNLVGTALHHDKGITFTFFDKKIPESAEF